MFAGERDFDIYEYMKHLCGMTKNYLASAIGIFFELQAKSTKNTISSLQLITTIGVVAGILGYLSKDTLPKFTLIGLLYFSLLMAMTWAVNGIVSKFFKNKRYDIKGQDIERNIK